MVSFVMSTTKEVSPKELCRDSVAHFQAKHHSHDEIFERRADGFSELLQPEGGIPVVCGGRSGTSGAHGSSGCDIDHPRVIALTGLYGSDWVFQVECVDIGKADREMVRAGDEVRPAYEAGGRRGTRGRWGQAGKRGP